MHYLRALLSIFLVSATCAFAASGNRYYSMLSDYIRPSELTGVGATRSFNTAYDRATAYLVAADEPVLVVDGLWYVTNDITVGPGIELVVLKNATISVDLNQTLTLNGCSFDSAYAPVFAGSGTVTGCVDVAVSHHAEWDGTISNYGLTNCAALIGVDDLNLPADLVTSNLLGPDSVSGDPHIIDYSVGPNDLASNSISGDPHIVDGSVNTNDLHPDVFEAMTNAASGVASTFDYSTSRHGLPKVTLTSGMITPYKSASASAQLASYTELLNADYTDWSAWTTTGVGHVHTYVFDLGQQYSGIAEIKIQVDQVTAGDRADTWLTSTIDAPVPNNGLMSYYGYHTSMRWLNSALADQDVLLTGFVGGRYLVFTINSAGASSWRYRIAEVSLWATPATTAYSTLGGDLQ